MEVSEAIVQKIKLHYSEEYQKTVRRLRELEEILKELEDVKIPVPAHSNQASEVTLTNTKVDSPLEVVKSETTAKRAYKKRNKKRGRKSVWGSFILKRLKAIHKPLTYDELTNHALVTMNMGREDFDKVRKSIVSAVFNLRNKQDQVRTLSKKGTRDKQVFLTRWLEDDETPKEEFKSYLA